MLRSSTKGNPSRRPRGLTLFELLIVICIVATLVTFAFESMLRLQEDAERASMQYTLAILKTTVQIRVAELLMERRGDQISQLTGQNPVAWLAEPPSNYLGAFSADEMREKSPGNWYFDTRKGQLVYIPRRAVFGAVGNRAPYELRFALRIDYETVDAPQGAVRRLAGVSLAPM